MMPTVDFGRYKRIVQYFWDPEPMNANYSELPVWCLGRHYVLSPPSNDENTMGRPSEEHSTCITHSSPSPQPQTPLSSTQISIATHICNEDKKDNIADDGGWPTPFLDDFEARLWMSYRSGFPAIQRSSSPDSSAAMSLSMRLRSIGDQGSFTSDTGWGCMIRSGQSLLANAILVHQLGRGWRRGTYKHEERQILSFFADDPRAPYSIHRFVEHGAKACGKHPGEWFGPSATARCIQELTNQDLSLDLRVYITGDGADVYEDSFMLIAKPDGQTFVPTLILVGTRLGIDKITPAYWEALKSSLQMPQSIGIAGGRPSSSHYFVGVQGSSLFYLDPHQTQPALPFLEEVDHYSEIDVDSCHIRRLRRIDIKDMDPSMLIGFLINSEDDWRKWRNEIQCVQGKAVIHVADFDPSLEGVGGPERDEAIDEVESLDEAEDDDGTFIRA